jgi:hypothetical protein
MIWAMLFLYLSGTYGFHCMARDLSNAPRSMASWMGLVFWPIVCAWGFVADAFDLVLEKVKP